MSDRYDPMLAKIVAHAGTRRLALDQLSAALHATRVLGVRTNVRFLRWLLDQPPMRDGEMRTDTIDRLTVPPLPDIGEAHWATAAAALTRSDGLWGGGWRLNAPPSARLRQDDVERVAVVSSPPVTSVAVDGRTAHVAVDGQSVAFSVAPAPTVDEAVRHASAQSGDGSAVLTAPMPGRVIAVRVAEGASVRAHEAVVVIEAMKMEHAVAAPIDGVLVSLLVAEGQQVQRGDLLGEVAQSPP